ncbi:DUF6314 family protein [Ascidiaceihabitans sp.]|uniref:DUF6314 family protein n=1 Tax=Ascidiaceihabitans sp. TaxID=1872644 RepID=UPI003298B2B7
MSARVLADFEGRWRIARRIMPSGQPEAAFNGEGGFARSDGGLAYHESGQLQIPGQTAMQSERRYVWDKDLNVFFQDGRFFHSVPNAGGETEHWCDPDHYYVTYLFEKWPRWRVTWRVLGPRKDYLMITDYSRKGSSA